MRIDFLPRGTGTLAAAQMDSSQRHMVRSPYENLYSPHFATSSSENHSLPFARNTNTDTFFDVYTCSYTRRFLLQTHHRPIPAVHSLIPGKTRLTRRLYVLNS